MQSADQWFEAYAVTHKNRINLWVHRIAAPVAATALVGLLWSLPVPAEFTRMSPVMNWGSAWLMAAIVYYFILSITLGLGMLPVVAAMVACIHWLGGLGPPLWASCALLLASSVAVMTAGHLVEGRPWRILVDLQLIMIAPALTLSRLYRKLHIPY